MIATVIGLIFVILALCRKPFETPMKEYFTIYLEPGEDIEDFALWAFGPDFERLHSSKLVDRWNDRHGDKYMVDPSCNPSDDAPYMISLWRDSIK